MSSPATTSKTGTTFLWVLGAFAIFAVLLAVVQTIAGNREIADPRSEERAANRAEVVKAQSELIAKMGLNDTAKKDALFTKTVELLKSKPAAASTQLVPGSPTQLKQAAATAAPAPAAPAQAPTPAGNAPAPAPGTSAPAPAAAPAGNAPAPATPAPAGNAPAPAAAPAPVPTQAPAPAPAAPTAPPAAPAAPAAPAK